MGSSVTSVSSCLGVDGGFGVKVVSPGVSPSPSAGAGSVLQNIKKHAITTCWEKMPSNKGVFQDGLSS